MQTGCDKSRHYPGIVCRQPVCHHLHDLVALDNDHVSINQLDCRVQIDRRGILIVHQVRIAVIHIHCPGRSVSSRHAMSGLPVAQAEPDRGAQNQYPDPFQRKPDQLEQVDSEYVIIHRYI